MILKSAVLGVAFACIPTVAAAQITTNDIKPYSPSLFTDCLGGSKDIASEYGISDPLQIIGALLYKAQDKDLSGQDVTFWARQPVAVPISVTTNTDIDTTACEKIFSVSKEGGFSVLGVDFSAASGDVFRMDLRQISKQSASDVIEGGIAVKVWTSQKYGSSFFGGIAFTHPAISQFYFFDAITIYVLRVERYKKVQGRLNGAIGWLAGRASYQRDNSFKGTRIIATGTSTLLQRAAFLSVGKAVQQQPAPPTSINSIDASQPSPNAGQPAAAGTYAGPNATPPHTTGQMKRN